jgi:ribonuclease Z
VVLHQKTSKYACSKKESAMARKRIIIPIAIFCSVILAYSLRGIIVVLVLERAIPKMMSATTAANLGDGLHIAICGAGGPLPDPKRAGACMLIIAGDTLLMIDSGSGGPRNIGRMQFPIGDVDAVLLTHFHSDHIDGLGETATLRWASGDNTSPLPVIGPTGVEKVVDGFNMAYSHDKGYRHDHHGDTVAPNSGFGLIAQAFATPATGASAVVWDKDGLLISAFSVDHKPVNPAVGYRIDYKGRSAVVSGDTAKSTNLEFFAKDTDLLLHEGLSPKLVMLMNKAAVQIGNAGIAKITIDILNYHASPAEAAESAQAANVKHLALYHIVPPLIVPGQDLVYLEGVADAYDGPTTLTQDGTIFSLPANGTEVIVVQKGL